MSSELKRHDLDHLAKNFSSVDEPNDLYTFGPGEGILLAGSAAESQGWFKSVRGINIGFGVLLVTTVGIKNLSPTYEQAINDLQVTANYVPCFHVVPTYDGNGQVISSSLVAIDGCDCCTGGGTPPFQPTYSPPACKRISFEDGPYNIPDQFTVINLTVNNISPFPGGACLLILARVVGDISNNRYVLFKNMVLPGLNNISVSLPASINGFQITPYTQVGITSYCCGSNCYNSNHIILGNLIDINNINPCGTPIPNVINVGTPPEPN